MKWEVLATHYITYNIIFLIIRLIMGKGGIILVVRAAVVIAAVADVVVVVGEAKDAVAEAGLKDFVSLAD